MCVPQGDAEDLPFPADSFDRYVSAGSIEYWWVGWVVGWLSVVGLSREVGPQLAGCGGRRFKTTA